MRSFKNTNETANRFQLLHRISIKIHKEGTVHKDLKFEKQLSDVINLCTVHRTRCQKRSLNSNDKILLWIRFRF